MCNYFIPKKMTIITGALFCIFMSFTAVLGIDSSLLESKILRGNDVAEYDMKYAVGIRINTVFTCSGFLVSYLCVAYAIKCTHGKHVTVDINNKNTNVTVEIGTKILAGINIRRIDYIHYLSNIYDPNNDFSPADIGIIKLRHSIVDVPNVGITGFAIEDTPINGEISIAGWEKVKYPNGWSQTKLKSINLELENNEECANIYDIPLHSNYHICAKTLNNCGIATKTDVGSPLILNGQFVIGVLSYVPPTKKGLPLVFTKISTYSQFILNEIEIANNENERCTDQESPMSSDDDGRPRGPMSDSDTE